MNPFDVTFFGKILYFAKVTFIIITIFSHKDKKDFSRYFLQGKLGKQVTSTSLKKECGE